MHEVMKIHWRGARVTRRGGLISLVFFFASSILLLIHYLLLSPTGSSSSDKDINESRYASFNAQINGEELLPIYALPSRSYFSFSSTTAKNYYDPPHLTPIDPFTLVSKGAYPIDEVHMNGYLHTGHVVFVMDASKKLLFLQRSSNVVTCPNTWSVLGEHTTIDDGSPWETVIRGIEEELGFRSFGHDTQTFPMSWTADFHPSHVTSSIKTRGASPLLPIRVTVRNVTEYPLYYIRHYGSRNNHRVDRQLTYLWLAYFPKREELLSWKLDEEVVNSKWISVEDVASWFSNDAAMVARSSGGVHDDNDNNRGDEINDTFGGAIPYENNKGGEKGKMIENDDGPDQGDFCHASIRSLYEVALTKITQIMML